MGRLSLVSLATLAVLGCSPKGQPPSSPASLKSKAEMAASAAAGRIETRTIPPVDNFFQEGIPVFCEVTHPSDGETCLQCKPDDLTLERCFPTKQAFNAKKTCTHDKDGLKCLVSENLTVIKLSFYKSEEKTFLKNFPTILQAMKTIASRDQEKKDNETLVFGSVLDFLEKESFAILTGQRVDELARETARIVSAQSRSVPAETIAAVEKQFREGVSSLKTQTRNGQLGPDDALKFVRDVTLPFVRDPDTRRMLETLSLDGLNGVSG